MRGLAAASADLSGPLTTFENLDPDPERFALIERNVHGALSAYKQIYDEMRDQTARDTLL